MDYKNLDSIKRATNFLVSLALLLGCSKNDDLKEITSIFEAKWSKNMDGCIVSAVRTNKFLVIGPNCEYGYQIKFNPEVSTYSYEKENDSVYSNDCEMQLEQINLSGLLDLVHSARILKLDSRCNAHDIVQLQLTEQENIYFIGKGSRYLSESVSTWLAQNSESIGERFYYVKGIDTIWSHLTDAEKLGCNW